MTEFEYFIIPFANRRVYYSQVNFSANNIRIPTGGNVYPLFMSKTFLNIIFLVYN